jgi:phage gpG-like protein
MARIEDHSAEFEKQLEVRVQRFLTDAAIIVLRRAREICKRRSGDLARSIFMVIGNNTARVGSNLPQAPIMEMGAKPHIIKPNSKIALWWKDAKYPVKLVNHPGVKPIPFLRPALESSKKDIEAVARREQLS